MRHRVLTMFERSGLGPQAELHPAVGDAIERDGERQNEALERRELKVEISLAIATVVASLLLVVFAPHHRDFDPVLAIALLVAYAVAYRVRFHDGCGYTAPTQVVLVPMLLLLPAATVPALVAAAMALANLDRCLRGTLHTQRLALSLADATYSTGPALVLALWGPSEPGWGSLPIYMAALVAQC